MILGKFKYNLDEKGRINFKKILDRFGTITDPEKKHEEVFYVFKDTVDIRDKNEELPVFYVFTKNSWKEFYDQMRKDLNDDDFTEFSMYYDEASLDKALRITFPDDFLEFIESDKEIFIKGMTDKLQVWSIENFNKYSDLLGNKKKPSKKFHGFINKSRKEKPSE